MSSLNQWRCLRSSEQHNVLYVMWKMFRFLDYRNLLVTVNGSYETFIFINSRARDPSPMTRVSPADASATIGVVIAQITSTDILTCIQALAQVGNICTVSQKCIQNIQ